MGTLRLLDAVASSERHAGEVYSCTYTPDGAFVLSAGWDGFLRLWDSASGQTLMALAASPKPLSCCASAPDGRLWFSGSMEGLLNIWDGISHQSLLCFVAHTRPISAICFAPDGQHLATASWDRQIVVRKAGKEREGRTLGSHQDIVAGCRYTSDGKMLVSWSYDGTIKFWDMNLLREMGTLSGHTDRVTTLALSPDGRYAISGGRDATVRLWDMDDRSEVATVNLGAEVRGCYYLLDAASVVVADGVGRLFLMSVPTFEVQAQVQTPYRVMCGDLSSSGMQLALGGEDGLIHFVSVEGFEESSLFVTATENVKAQAGLLDRFLGKTRLRRMYCYTCPACRQTLESPSLPTQAFTCPKCRRRLRVNPRVPQMQGS